MTIRVYQSERATRAARLHAGQGSCALLDDGDIAENAGGIRHDNTRGEALHVVRQIGRGAAVAAVPGRVSAMLFICSAPSVELMRRCDWRPKAPKAEMMASWTELFLARMASSYAPMWGAT